MLVSLKCVTTPTLSTNEAAAEACSVGNVMMGSGGGLGGLAGGFDGGLDGGLAGGFDGGGSVGVEGGLPVADEVDTVRALQPSKPLNNVPAAREMKRSQRGLWAKLRCERANGVLTAGTAIAKGRKGLKFFLKEEGFKV